ncbi:MAG: ATP-binding protein [Veillonellales bacterium]
MKELVIVSGKGGTGKTSISAALAFIALHKILVDCDVDAANLHLISGAVLNESHEFTAGFEPHIDKSRCTACGKCTDLCRFGAITNGVLTSPFNCEGCGVCSFNCPAQAIQMQNKKAGQWFISDTRLGRLVHAELGLSVENSGKLVNKVRQEAKKIAAAEQISLIITDGPPGIGCPAIAALSGADLALAVVEPSITGIHDLTRLVDLVSHFNLPLTVCINKSNLHPENTRNLIAWCQQNAIAVAGQLPYSDIFRHAVQDGKTVMEMPSNEDVKQPLIELWINLLNRLAIIDQSKKETK